MKFQWKDSGRGTDKNVSAVRVFSRSDHFVPIDLFAQMALVESKYLKVVAVLPATSCV